MNDAICFACASGGLAVGGGLLWGIGAVVSARLRLVRAARRAALQGLLRCR